MTPYVAFRAFTVSPVVELFVLLVFACLAAGGLLLYMIFRFGADAVADRETVGTNGVEANRTPIRR